jgi:hypothetical protein
LLEPLLLGRLAGAQSGHWYLTGHLDTFWQVDEVTRQAETRPGERLSDASSQSRCFSMPVVWAQLDSALHRDLISTCV